ncbi:MAG: tRNA pseudouridine(38-40) synthase TruA [Simkaniaceae bacterium]|nr:tRNA pseudouridine(38-40) synthase TruA [Simkaniaceae bacterium]
MYGYKITIAYDGSPFGGWQVQPGILSVQGCVQDALGAVLRERITVVASGRTDAGVHAVAQVAHFHTHHPLPDDFLTKSHSLLPKEIRINEIEEVALTFHARFGARTKTYGYEIIEGPALSPLERPYKTHVRERLDLPAMEEALNYFIGTHDFTSFANRRGRGDEESGQRTIYTLTLTREPEGRFRRGFRFEITGNGFLYKMVRNMVSTLLEVGKGRRMPSSVASLLAARNRRLAPPPAPPSGLYLLSVDF